MTECHKLIRHFLVLRPGQEWVRVFEEIYEMPASTARLQTETIHQQMEIPAKDIILEPAEVTLRGLTDGAVAGSTNDTVLRFASANDVQVGNTAWMTITHSATAGDSVTLWKRGRYRVEHCFHQAASSTVLLGISADASGTALTGDPSMTAAGMRDVGGAVLPAATSMYHKLCTEIRVSEAEAKVGKVVRAHGSNGAGAVVADATIGTNTDCYLRITLISDLTA